MKNKNLTIHISKKANLKLENLKLKVLHTGKRIPKEDIVDWMILHYIDYKLFEKAFLEWVKSQSKILEGQS